MVDFKRFETWKDLKSSFANTVWSALSGGVLPGDKGLATFTMPAAFIDHMTWV